MDKGVFIFFIVLGFIVIGMFVGLIIFFNLNSEKVNIEEKSDCVLLREDFDKKINYFDAVECNKIELFDTEDVYVGGTLLNVTMVYDRVLKRYEHGLNFIGNDVEGWIFILSEGESIPYEIGKFYKFDLVRKCDFLESSTDVGFYNDAGFKELEMMDC